MRIEAIGAKWFVWPLYAMILATFPSWQLAESRLLGKEGHELWTYHIIQSEFLEPVCKQLEQTYPGYPVREHLVKLAIGRKMKLLDPKQVFTPYERVYGQIITGDFFGADRIDYLIRDAKSTGVSHGLFDYSQLIEMLVVVTDDRQLDSWAWKRMVSNPVRHSCFRAILCRDGSISIPLCRRMLFT